jgi:signal transduction histidine kinase
MLMHILENALSYSPADSPVTVGAERSASGLDIRISDNGPGIPDDEKRMIFTKFFRGIHSGLLPGGTGLGLPIALEIARVHEGTIRVEDNRPSGTVFIISLPSGHVREETEDDLS